MFTRQDGRSTIFQMDQAKPEDQISFVGTSKNAVMTRIWVALCVYLLLVFLRFQSMLHINTQQILRLLQLNLFEKRGLMVLLRGDPTCDNQPDINQMVLL